VLLAASLQAGSGRRSDYWMLQRLILAAAGLLWLGGAAHAQDVSAGMSPQTSTTQKKAPPDDEWGFRWDDRPSLRLGRGTRVDFRFRLQADVKDSDAPLPEEDDPEASAVDIARRRIGIEGEILNLFDYQVESELSAAGSNWRDVYINYKQFGFAEVLAGKFKLPFSLDENTSSTNLDFVYRSRAAELLAPGRDRGVMAHGRVLDRGVLRYEIGLFEHDGSNARRTSPNERVHADRTTAGRATVQPLRATKSVFSDLSVGAAFTKSMLGEGFPDLRGRTPLDLPFYRPDVWVNGTRRRVGVELRWRPGPYSIKAEYIRLTDERLGESVEDTDLSPLLGTGWYVSGTWAITGENKADGLDRPRRPLLFKDSGFGAVEVAARIENISFRSEAADDVPSDGPRADVVAGNADRIETFGVNWYLNRWFKVQFNLIRETLADPARGPLPGQPTFWSRVVRFQFAM
jgi:phosphate-selective porin